MPCFTEFFTSLTCDFASTVQCGILPKMQILILGASEQIWFGSPSLGILYLTGMLLLMGLLVHGQAQRIRERSVQREKDAQASAINDQLVREKERSENELENYLKFVSGSGVAILQADARGLVIAASGPLLATYGLLPQDLIGKHQLSILDPSSQRKLLACVYKDGGLPSYRCKLRIKIPGHGLSLIHI